MSDHFTLSNGVTIPSPGFGTYLMPEGPATVDAIVQALRLGYRHIDTAYFYGNETCVGEAIRASGLPRKEIFVTSKVWNTDRGYQPTLAAFEKTMTHLGLDYLDLYLIHWPAYADKYDNWEDINRETWRAMTELYQSGRVRAIGVSNFKPHHLKALLESPGPGARVGSPPAGRIGPEVRQDPRADLPALVPGQGLSAPAQVRDAQPHPGEPEHLRLRPDPGGHRQARRPAPLRGIGTGPGQCALLSMTRQG